MLKKIIGKSSVIDRLISGVTAAHCKECDLYFIKPWQFHCIS